MAEAEVFQLDGTPRSSFSKQRVAEDASASSSEESEPVALQHAAASEANGQEQGSSSTVPKQPNESIELSRRAVPEVQQDPDVCSICLDEFTADDPSNSTQCGHMFHLQCIMQWAQRSQECPMCFKALRLQEESLNELLPFGEYRPPEQATPNHVLLGLEAWELDRLLARLATHGNSSSGRRSRAQRQVARASRAAAVRAAAESGNVASVLTSGGGGGAAAGRSGDGEAWSGGGSEAASPPIAVGRNGHSAAGSGADGDANSAAYPASWPPASHRRQYSREPGAGGEHDTHPASPAVDLRTRWAAVSSRAKESLSRTTSELRSFWARGSNRTGHPHGGTGGVAM